MEVFHFLSQSPQSREAICLLASVDSNLEALQVVWQTVADFLDAPEGVLVISVIGFLQLIHALLRKPRGYHFLLQALKGIVGYRFLLQALKRDS